MPPPRPNPSGLLFFLQTAEPAGLSLRADSDSGSKRQDPDTQLSLLLQQGQAQASGHTEKTSQASRPRPPIPAKPQLPPEVYTSPASRLHQAPPINPIYQEPDEPIAFYAMGRGSPGDAPSNIYAEVEGPSGTAPIGHPILRKCWSRPISRGQVREVQGKISSRSRAERGSPS